MSCTCPRPLSSRHRKYNLKLKSEISDDPFKRLQQKHRVTIFSQTFLYLSSCLLVLGFVEAVGEAALPAVVTVKVARHEHAGAALVSGALAPQPVDFTVLIHLKEEKCWF